MPWWPRPHREVDLDRELRAHLDLEAEELRESGVTRRAGPRRSTQWWRCGTIEARIR